MVTTLKVDGMTCGGCVQNVTNLLNGIAGVSNAEVTLTPGRAVVTHDDSVSPDTFIHTVEEAGYDAALA